MPLERAKARQEKLEKALLDIGQCDIKADSPEVLITSVVEVMGLTLAVVTYLSLNVRDVLMLLNRQDPDANTGPDSEPAKLGAERSPETQVEPGAETEAYPGAEPGAQDPAR